jgi:hypothetical protein
MTTVETTKEKWIKAEVIRTAGEIALMSPEPGAAKAEIHWVNPFAPFNQRISAWHSGLIDPQQRWPVTRYRGSATAPAFAARLPQGGWSQKGN